MLEQARADVIVAPHELLAASTECLDPLLATDRARQRIVRAGTNLPDGTSFVGFECRLASDDDRVDFGTGVAAGDGGRDLIAGAPDRGSSADDPWRALRRACRAWRDDPGLARSMPALYTEIDLAADGAPREPSLFARIDWPRRTSWCDELAEAHRAGRVFLDACYGAPSPEAHVRTLDACVRALPPNGWLHGVAVMLGRPERNPRLGLWIPRWHLRDYLARIGSHAIAADLDGLTRDVPDARGPFVELALDVVASAISPRVGVELTLDANGAGSGPHLLRVLVERGLCAPEKATALSRWPGSEALPGAATGWPVCRLVRRISHLKLVLEPGPRVQAKAYLTATPSFALLG